jgi:hypothetical protein
MSAQQKLAEAARMLSNRTAPMSNGSNRRNRRKKKRAGPSLSKGLARERKSGIPAAMGSTMESMTYSYVAGASKHKDFDDGVLVKGREYLCSIGDVKDTTSLWLSIDGDGKTPADFGYFGLNPGNLTKQSSGGVPRLGQQATLYSRYCYRRVIFEYIPAVGTTTSGQFVMAFEPYSTLASGYASASNESWFPTVSSIVPNAASQWYSGCKVIGHYRGDLNWSIALPGPEDGKFVFNDTTNNQALFLGANFTTPTANLTKGTIYMYYECEFYGGIRPQFSSTSSMLSTSALSTISTLKTALCTLGPDSSEEEVSAAIADLLVDCKGLRPPLLRRS